MRGRQTVNGLVHDCNLDEVEVCILEAGGEHVEKSLWAIPIFGNSKNLFC